MSDHVEKNCCASVIRLVTKSLPHLGRSFSWPERAEASFHSRQQPGTATVSRAGAVTRVFKFHERPDYIHIVQGPGRQSHGLGTELREGVDTG